MSSLLSCKYKVEEMVAPKPSAMYTERILRIWQKRTYIDLESHIKVRENTHSLFIAADRRHRVKNKHFGEARGSKTYTTQTICYGSVRESKGRKKTKLSVEHRNTNTNDRETAEGRERETESHERKRK